jgi:hypothetical protein
MERHTRPGTIKITDNMCHTSLVTHNSGQVNGLLGVILVRDDGHERYRYWMSLLRTFGKDLTFPR